MFFNDISLKKHVKMILKEFDKNTQLKLSRFSNDYRIFYIRVLRI